MTVFKDSLKSVLSRAARLLKNAVFPEDITCDVCGSELVAATRYRLCADCYSHMPFTPDHVCAVCGAPILNEADYCIRCQNTESRFVCNRSPLSYEGKAKELILSLKFGNKRYITQTLGAMMSDEYLRRGLSCDIGVFVPMSDDEFKKRGFNQAELLAREVGHRLDIPILPALVKNRSTATQKNLTAKERAENLAGVFSVVFGQVAGRRILLIDDVFTTGATADECAKALLKAKAKDVTVLTAAVTKQKIFME